jgi:hypothetical protein
MTTHLAVPAYVALWLCVLIGLCGIVVVAAWLVDLAVTRVVVHLQMWETLIEFSLRRAAERKAERAAREGRTP